jgi:hypothetical protein
VLYAIHAEIHRKAADARNKIKTALDKNKSGETLLMLDRNETESLADATLDDFSKLTVSLLKNFLFVRHPTMKLSGINKGTLKKAQDWEENLIHRSFNARRESIKLELETENTETEAQDEDVPYLPQAVTHVLVEMKGSAFKCTEEASAFLANEE